MVLWIAISVLKYIDYKIQSKKYGVYIVPIAPSVRMLLETSDIVGFGISYHGLQVNKNLYFTKE